MGSRLSEHSTFTLVETADIGGTNATSGYVSMANYTWMELSCWIPLLSIVRYWLMSARMMSPTAALVTSVELVPNTEANRPSAKSNPKRFLLMPDTSVLPRSTPDNQRGTTMRGAAGRT